MLLKYGIGEDSWESLGQQRYNQYILKEISPEYSLEGLMWSWNSSVLAIWWEELTHWKRPWCWERLREGREGDHRGRDGWMASPTQWTWVWSISRRWWKTGKPGLLQSMGLQRVGQNWATEQQQTQWVQDSDPWSYRLTSCCLAHLWTNSLRYSSQFEQYQNSL